MQGIELVYDRTYHSLLRSCTAVVVGGGWPPATPGSGQVTWALGMTCYE